MFRITEYDPSATIVPWFVKKKKSEDPDIANSKKAIRPTKTDFKDDAHWALHREHVKTTLKSQGLLHLIDESFVPTNQDLDRLGYIRSSRIHLRHQAQNLLLRHILVTWTLVRSGQKYPKYRMLA